MATPSPTPSPGPGAPSRAGDLHPANNRADINSVEDTVLAAVKHFGYPDASVFALRLALEEALVNAFMHGHRGLPASETIHLHFEAGPDQVRIEVTDKGPGYKPEAVADPTLEENIELPSGRGLMLIRNFMSEVRHELDGRRLVMVYQRPEQA